jgi:uncharacterized protein (DUF305 family)
MRCTVPSVGLLLGNALIASADGPAPTKQEARFEVGFLTNMIDHHAMAVMMAALCEDRAVHPELVALCKQMRTSQAVEVEEMQAWLTDWYGVEHEPEMTKGMERQMERLASLSGAEFEIAFMRMMIRHHRTAVREAGKCEDRAYHAALVEMCEGIVETQLQEIDLMEGWLDEWYNR